MSGYVDRKRIVKAFMALDDFQRDECFPGGVEQAERVIRGYVYLIAKDADYSTLLEIYMLIVMRIIVLNRDNEQIVSSLGPSYRHVVPEDRFDMLVRFTRAFHNDYQTAGMTRDEDDVLGIIMDLLQGQDRQEDCPMADALEKPGFGTDIHNPIYTQSAKDSYDYLNHLYTPDGVPLVWLRRGSIMTEFFNNPVDHYVLCRPEGKGYMKLFVYMYSKETSSYCPRGTISGRHLALPEKG